MGTLWGRTPPGVCGGPGKAPSSWADPSFPAPVGGCSSAPPGERPCGTLPGADPSSPFPGARLHQAKVTKVSIAKAEGGVGAVRPSRFSQQQRISRLRFVLLAAEGLTSTLKPSPRDGENPFTTCRADEQVRIRNT